MMDPQKNAPISSMSARNLYEARNLRIERLVVLRHDLLFNFAFSEVDDAVGKCLSIFFVMRHKDRRRARLLQETTQIVANPVLK